MSNQEEIPVFFGEMLAGPYRPRLVYLFHFKDTAERNANWVKFSDDPDWKAMRVKPEYAGTESKIWRTFLRSA